ncbi:MAG TPA: hypothetical protein VII28_01290 [Puia sp.]
MSEEKNDMGPDGPGKKIPASLDRQLRALLPEKELNHFRDQLPDAFLNDASEGLNQVHDNSNLDGILKKLNLQMHQQLSHKKKKSGRKSIGDMSWIYWAIVIVLLLIICAFLVIRMQLHH